jgi:hypothetical protein
VSCGVPVVVLQDSAEPLSAADFVRLDWPSADRRLPACRSGEAQGRMRPLAVVVVDVLGQQVIEMPRAADDEVVEALSLNALDQALDMGIQIGRSVRQAVGRDAGVGEGLVECRPVFGVAVPRQVQRGEPLRLGAACCGYQCLRRRVSRPPAARRPRLPGAGMYWKLGPKRPLAAPIVAG